MDYWNGNAPVMEKHEYNGESLMLPKVAPVDADVSAKTVILQRTIDLIRQHAGGRKVNWYWKCHLLTNRMRGVAPSAFTLTLNALVGLADQANAAAYTFSDVVLYGPTISGFGLDMDDPADATVILAATRDAVRWVSATLTF